MAVRGPEPVQVRKLDSLSAWQAHVEALGVDIPLRPPPEGDPRAPADPDPLDAALPLPGGLPPLANRFAVLPMEGWDATGDGRPTDLVRRRWRRFGESGAALIWGGEAVAVREDGRANPNQLRLGPDTVGDLAALRGELLAAHREAHPDQPEPVVGLQLTHSGRYARPQGGPAPRIAYRHPVLDGRVGVDDDGPVLSDGELEELADDFVVAAVRAGEAGYAFVDVKHCHGYLGHELLSGFARPGVFGGELANRTRFLRRVVEGIRVRAPELAVGVRLSVFDLVPYRPGPDGVGEPEAGDPYPYAFGGDGTATGTDLREPLALVDLLAELDVRLLCVTAGSPYYNPHIQRPALFPPSDGYTPPEDPLVGVARLLEAAAAVKAHRPDVVVVGSGYSYLQEWLPHVARAVVADGGADVVGIGRMVLSYPGLPADVLAGRPLDRRLLCRTFSDCTTAPRNGLISGCYPLDEFYKERPERTELAAVKRTARRAVRGSGG